MKQTIQIFKEKNDGAGLSQSLETQVEKYLRLHPSEKLVQTSISYYLDEKGNEIGHLCAIFEEN